MALQKYRGGGGGGNHSLGLGSSRAKVGHTLARLNYSSEFTLQCDCFKFNSSCTAIDDDKQLDMDRVLKISQWRT